jgi:hypothetical protein
MVPFSTTNLHVTKRIPLRGDNPFCGLFLECTASEDRRIGELVVAYMWHCSSISVEELNETTQNFSQDIWYPGQVMNRDCLNYKSRELILDQYVL